MSVEQNAFDTYDANSYNLKELGISLAVRQRTLDNPQTKELLSKFLQSRRQGLSRKTLRFYECYLSRAPIGTDISFRDIDQFL